MSYEHDYDDDPLSDDDGLPGVPMTVAMAIAAVITAPIWLALWAALGTWRWAFGERNPNGYN